MIQKQRQPQLQKQESLIKSELIDDSKSYNELKVLNTPPPETL